MRKIRVVYMGLLRNTVGVPEEEVEVPAGSRVVDLLAILQKAHGADFENAVFTRNGELRSLIEVFIGDHNINELEGLNTEIEAADGVYILLLAYIAAGGQAVFSPA
ncbi:MAG: MoaD/ThiS family protein [Chloroflexi bacterium]|nr:MoaD/ThiS family protein [Chloroflexota bacterium]